MYLTTRYFSWMPGAKGLRGYTVVVPDWYRQYFKREVNRLKREEKMTHRRLGAELARHVKRRSEWKAPNISRFLKGKQHSSSLLHAFCSYFGVRYPIVSAEAEKEVEWLEAGRALLRENEEAFDLMLKRISTDLELSQVDRKLTDLLEKGPSDAARKQKRR